MPPILLTQRLRLRPPREEDLGHIFRLSSSPRVMRYISPGKVQSWEEAEVDLKKRMGTAALPLGYWVVEEKITTDFVGWMALKPVENSPQVEMGYRFMETHWSRGYATEGGMKVLEYAFRTLGLKRVIAIAMEENRASTRVMEKLGMSYSHRGIYYGRLCVCYEIAGKKFSNLNSSPTKSI